MVKDITYIVKFTNLEYTARWIFFFRFYLFISRERGREGKREGEKHRCVRETSVSCLSHTPNWGPGLESRHVPSLGLEPETFRFAGQYSTHWARAATPARARWTFTYVTYVYIHW